MLKKIPIHPILFTIYPILFLYTNNISILDLNNIYLPILLSVSLTILFWFILNLFIKNKDKSSLITSLMIVLFFSYGHLIGALNKSLEKTLGISSDLYLSINYLLVSIAGVYIIIKLLKNYLYINRLLNFISFILIAPTLYITLAHSFETHTINDSIEPQFNTKDSVIINHLEKERPDIYYIILDGYGRDDVLRTVYHFDNGNFLRELMNRGFFISRKSRANYVQTLLSLSSSLNINYIDSLIKNINPTADNREPLNSLISSNFVVKYLKTKGYKIVTFSSGFSPTEIKNSDLYIESGTWLNEFEDLIINTTLIHLLRKIFSQSSPLLDHKKNILLTLAKLKTLNNKKLPLFVFAHIIAPHPPFVLGSDDISEDENSILYFGDGSMYTNMKSNLQEEYKNKYIEQVKALNTKVLEMIDGLLSLNNKEKVIILQADHGPRMLLNWENPSVKSYSETFPIFNAFYFTHRNNIIPYNSVTPVNTFRLIFNYYFNGNYQILDNKSYFSSWSHPYDFIEVQIKD